MTIAKGVERPSRGSSLAGSVATCLYAGNACQINGWFPLSGVQAAADAGFRGFVRRVDPSDD